jgi:predicted nucleic acid-binding protein
VNVGLDASVLVRLLTGRPERQAALASSRLREELAAGRRVVVTDLALAETWYALTAVGPNSYGVAPAAALDAIRSLLASRSVTLEPSSGAIDALKPSAGSAGFVDRLLVARHGALSLSTLTLDRQQAKLPGADLLR